MTSPQRAECPDAAPVDAGRATHEPGVAPWLVIAGGGTAGHVQAGLAVASEITGRGVPLSAIGWVGSSRGIETRLVPEAGIALTALGGRGLRRRLSFANIAAVGGLAGAFVRAWRLLGARRPAVVLGLGGYASVACGVAAALRRIPLVLIEQNAVPGAANRLLSRFCATSATAFDNTGLRNAHTTGNPVSQEVLHVDRQSGHAAARADLRVPDGRRLVAVFGGSLGAARINEAVAQAVTTAAPAGWSNREDLCVRHMCGSRNHQEMQQRLGSLIAHDSAPAPGVLVHLVDYEDHMAKVYAACDLVVCRAGATTVAELTAAGVPAVLVPLPGAPGDHQTANARALVRAGAAVMVNDSALDGARLVSEVDALLANPARLEAMSRAARAASKAHTAAADVADLVTRCATRAPNRSD